ncbi:MAG: hypothetical protein Q7J29_09855 [Stagnimonas sp.]|nr:hypothetical protein [Stagnimonas sp.]
MNDKDNRRWVTDAHRKLAEAEKARYRWLTETSQWHVNGDPQRVDFARVGNISKLVIAVIILILMQVMLQRSVVESSVTDELIGIEPKTSAQ